MDEAIYQAAIPACCKFRTAQEHLDMLGLCWGLLAAIDSKRAMDCSGCECATRAAQGSAIQDGGKQ